MTLLPSQDLPASFPSSFISFTIDLTNVVFGLVLYEKIGFMIITNYSHLTIHKKIESFLSHFFCVFKSKNISLILYFLFCVFIKRLSNLIRLGSTQLSSHISNSQLECASAFKYFLQPLLFVPEIFSEHKEESAAVTKNDYEISEIALIVL
jgi:hypothetical protein